MAQVPVDVVREDEGRREVRGDDEAEDTVPSVYSNFRGSRGHSIAETMQ